MHSPLEIIGKTYGDMEVVDYVGCTDNKALNVPYAEELIIGENDE